MSNRFYIPPGPNWFDHLAKGIQLGLTLRAANQRSEEFELQKQELQRKQQERQTLRGISEQLLQPTETRTPNAMAMPTAADYEDNPALATNLTPYAQSLGKEAFDVTRTPPSLERQLMAASVLSNQPATALSAYQHSQPPRVHNLPGVGPVVVGAGGTPHFPPNRTAGAQSDLGKLIADRKALEASGADQATLAAFDRSIEMKGQAREGSLNPYDARAMAQFGRNFRDLPPGSEEQKQVINAVDQFKETVVKLQLERYGLDVKKDQRIPPEQLEKITDMMESDQLMSGIAEAHAKAFPKGGTISAALQGAISKNNTIRTIKEAVFANSNVPAEQEFNAHYNNIIAKLRKLTDERQLSELDAVRNLQSFNPAVSTDQFQKNVDVRRQSQQREMRTFINALRGQGRDVSVVEPTAPSGGGGGPAAPTRPATPTAPRTPAGERKVINGKAYIKKNGQWFEE
jgi:hypothetical protein